MFPEELPASRIPTTTDDALKLFFPGQKVWFKPPDCAPVGFTVCKLSTPVTKSVVILAELDGGDSERVVIKIYDPRYLDERIASTASLPSYPWNLADEQAAAMARPRNSQLTMEELSNEVYAYSPEELSGEDLAAHHLLKEELLYRLLKESYESELAAYERLKDFQGSVIPRLIMAGQLIPLDTRSIQPPALVLEYIPSVSLFDVSPTAITPAICAQLLSAMENFPLHGVVHNDITLNNIHFTPPERPERGVLIDFGWALIRGEQEDDDDEEYWIARGASDVRWARRLLEDKDLIIRKSAEGRVPRSGFS